MVAIEDGMNDLKEMVKRQAEEIERINKEQEAWRKQQQEFQTILINLGLGQQAPQQ
jgi:cell wall assembly regulator SMI1